MTLSQTAVLTKRIILSSAIFLTITILGLIGYNIWHEYYLRSLPPVEEKPDVKFGLLPSPDFPKTEVSSSNFSYTIDTVTGSLPKIGVDKGFDKIIKVYFVTRSYATLLSSEKSQALASKFGINQDPQILSENTYLFKDQEKSLTVDLDTGNFKYVNEASPQSSLALDPDNKLISDFQNFLSSLVGFKDELKNGRSKVISFSSKAQLAQISLWPNNVDNRLIYTPQFDKSLVNASVSAQADKLENFLSVSFTSWPVDTTTFATYPAKDLPSALEDLKTGKGIVVVTPSKPQVSITSVSVGYYLSEKYHPYLLPIYIFSGPDFDSYVSAISELYITGSENI